MVVLSGKEQEQWLDDNNIYYVHVEAKPKESFETFKKRMYRQIEENKDYIDSSNSNGKLVFALTKEWMTSGTLDTDNIVEIMRRNSDDRFEMRLDLPKASNELNYLLVKVIKTEFKNFLKDRDDSEKITLSELVDPDFNLFVSDTLNGFMPRLQLLEDLFKEDLVDLDVCDEDFPVPSLGNEEDDNDLPCVTVVVAEVQDDEDEEPVDEDEDYTEDEDDYDGCAYCDDIDCPHHPNHRESNEDAVDVSEESSKTDEESKSSKEDSKEGFITEDEIRKAFANVFYKLIFGDDDDNKE